MMRKLKNRKSLPPKRKRLTDSKRHTSTDTEKIFHNNVGDIIESLIIVMMICGIHECKANGTKEIILSIFDHYDEARHRQNCSKPPRKMCKANVIYYLAEKCLMTLVEAQLTYYIMKFALKAFYNNIPKNGIRNPLMDAQLMCEQEFAWKRAARRTLQVLDNSYGIFKPLVRNYKAEIMGVYKELYERMKKRTELVQNFPHCKNNCKNYEKQAETKIMQQNIQERDGHTCSRKKSQIQINPFEPFKICCKCKFPLELCNCYLNKKDGKLCVDCSQGPFRCVWFLTDEMERIKSKQHICPIDCVDKFSTLSED